ncbi:MAG TPA: hypothetical protein VFX78_08890 [Candidatus Eisenbacteria bacterium]|nr:hypothetical protein [Candidatus Eisenbacteria bacterium]
MAHRVALRRLAPAALASLCAALLALPAPARATVFLSSVDQGSWTAADKELHAAGSLAIAASIRVTGRSEAESFTAAVSVGVLKEIYDATIKPSAKKGASWKDLAADILGAAAGVLLLRAMD